MHALEVKLDGVALAIAGAPKAIILAVHINFSIEQDRAYIDISGMNDLGSERRSHTNWVMQQSLPRQGRLELSLIDTPEVTPPIREIATDDAQHLADMADYEQRQRDEPFSPRVLETVSPHATLALTLGGQRTVASLESGREFLSFSLHWDAWRPGQCRVSLSSFSQAEALARHGSRDWVRGKLGLGESLLVEFGSARPQS